MKLLTATTAGQGTRSNDFTFCIEGELVWIGLVCGTDRRNPDGGCGCGRAFSGLNSQRATTTAQVRDLPLSRDDVVTALGSYYQDAGYGCFDRQDLADEVDQMIAMVADWNVGEIIERRLEVVGPRALTR